MENHIYRKGDYINKVIILGRLTRDAEFRYSQGENATAIARFTLAVDRRYKKNGEPSADFISCVAFGKTAEVIEKYTVKGTKLAVEGRWQTGSYKNKDGQTVYTNDCVVEAIDFAESKGTNSEGNKEAAPQVDADGFMNIPDGDFDGMPFN